METIKLKHLPDGQFVTDSFVSSDEWISVLHEAEIEGKISQIQALLRFFRMPAHKGTCSAVAKVNGTSSDSERSLITNFGMFTRKALGNRFIVESSESEDERYWPIPMLGKDLGKKGFEWTVRPELVDALRDFLLDKLMESYRGPVITQGLDSSRSYELYKWKDIAVYQGKSNEEIVRYLASNSCNFVERGHFGATLSSLLETSVEGVIQAFERLLQNKPLEERLKDFSNAAKAITPAGMTSFGDERTAAAFLACADPQKYTPYTSTIYEIYCKYLGISTKAAGQKYVHFLEILDSLIPLEQKDIELQEALHRETDPYFWSDRLNAQDILWQMKEYMEESMSKKNQVMNNNETASPINIPSDMKKYIDLLRANRNIVLTGAPGTGKTYLAKLIAKGMGCTDEEVGFVQFHPSYDYTDFVEGLRPMNGDDGSVAFERRDGVFKEFCAKALVNYEDSKKNLQTLQQESSVRDLVEEFIQDAIEANTQFETQGTKNVFHIINSRARTITIEIPQNEKTNVISLSKSDLVTLLENKVDISGSKEIQAYFNRKYRTQEDSYTFVLYDKLRKTKTVNLSESVSLIPRKNYVFIIDEINRGELSKIFGELFFAIDPGYRGAKGCVKTQYQNLVEPDDPFEKGFYVPENVYIIGTMNDIDRGVESMDFAIRRRFAWVEVKAEDRVAMLDEKIPDWSEAAKRCMISLNEGLKNKDIGLTDAYDIGPAYFLKLEEYDGDFEKLWDYHIKGILTEYLRGTRNIEEKVEGILKAKYDAYKE